MVGRPPSRSWRHRVVGVAALVVGGALLLAACSSPRPAARTTTSSPRSTTTTTTTGPGATGSSGATSTSTASPVAACSSGSLVLAEDVAKSSTGAGSADIVFTLTNDASTPCSLRGFPAVTFRSAPGSSGTAVSIGTQQTGPGPSLVVLDARGVAAFYLVVGNVPVGGVGCVDVGVVEVTPPGGGSPISVDASFSACGPSVGVTSVEPLDTLST
ncbi:MAG: DUF4232 domain-containing protein [Actinomycetota bacterium]|nr:DUF4232 domain-containing protein [Actinomycetota bacterium]